VARSRKSPDKSEARESAPDQDDRIEDAVVVGETGPSEPGETSREDAGSPPSDGASVVDATEHTEVAADEDQAAARKLEEEQEPEELAAAEHEAGASSVEARDHTDEGEETPDTSERDSLGEEPVEETTVQEPPAAEPVADADERPEPPPPSPPPQSRGIGAGGVAALIFGGIIAGFIGLFASRYVLPDGWPGQGAETEAALAEIAASSEEVRTTVEAQSARIADLQSSLEALRGDVEEQAAIDPGISGLREELGGELDALEGTVSGISDQVNSLSATLGDLAARVEQLELRPMPEGLDTSSLDAEIADFREELSAAVEQARDQVTEAQRQAAAIAAEAAEDAAQAQSEAAEEAERLRAEAEEAAATATLRAAVARVVSAVENGEPYAEELADVSDPPDALAAYAETGVPTQAALQDAFAPAARDALDASIRGEAGDTPTDRLMAFLRVQTGARSLEPRAGNDPDAVLSRAEAALRQGDLEAALVELDSLPEAGRAGMSGWIADARARLEAEQAAAELARSLNDN